MKDPRGRVAGPDSTTTASTESRIAVVVPVLDRTEPLLESLVSVATQQRLPFRVAVVDDGSKEPIEGAVSR